MTPVRQRKSRLTSDALEVLEGRLRELYDQASEAEGEKIPLNWAASAMGVSVKTARLIRSQGGNDKSVLQEAFRALELKWDDNYCEKLPAKEVAGPSSDEPELPEIVSQPPQRTPVRHRRIWLLASFAAACLAVFVVFTRPTVSAHGKPEQLSYYEEAHGAYHAGEYTKAEHLANRAERLSVEHKDANTLADVLRLQGEILAAHGDLAAAVERYKEAHVFFKKVKLEWEALLCWRPWEWQRRGWADTPKRNAT